MKCSTGKTCYPSRRYANQVAERALKQRGVTLHPYPCGECNRFHVSRWALSNFLRLADDAALRRVADALGNEIAFDTDNYINKRLAEIGAEIQTEIENEILTAFQQIIDRYRQRKALEELGIK